MFYIKTGKQTFPLEIKTFANVFFLGPLNVISRQSRNCANVESFLRVVQIYKEGLKPEMFPWILIEGKSEMRDFAEYATHMSLLCDTDCVSVYLWFCSFTCVSPLCINSTQSVFSCCHFCPFMFFFICLLNKICVLFELFQLPPALAENESDNLEFDIKEQLWTI